MDISDRLKRLREYFGLSQREFSNRINIGQSTLAMFETGQRSMKDIHISQICSEFSVNENWLRYGQGEMFVQLDEFSLDEYAKQNDLTELELDILKAYMELDGDVRKEIIFKVKSIFNKHSDDEDSEETTKEESMKNAMEKELESYKLELSSELKGETSSVSEDTDDIEGRTS